MILRIQFYFYIICKFSLTFISLENALRNFACLTTGDVIAIDYNDKVIFYFEINFSVLLRLYFILIICKVKHKIGLFNPSIVLCVNCKLF